MTDQVNNKPLTITLDGVEHQLADFSAQVQQAVSIYNRFTVELGEEQLKVLKTQTAINELSRQIGEAVKAELAAKAAPAANDEVEDATPTTVQ